MNLIDNINYQSEYTQFQGHAVELAKLNADKFDVIVAVGGDGTVHEVVNGIMLSGSKPVMGIIPSGTGNDFVRMFPKFNPTRFVEKIAHSKSFPIDLLQLNGSYNQAYCINACDIGFGAAVVNKMNKQRNAGVKGKLSYGMAIVRTFLSYKNQFVHLNTDHLEYKSHALMVALCNGRYFGNGLAINPEADIADGKIEITIIGKVSLLEYVKYLGRLKKGRKINHPEVRYESGTKVVFKMKSTSVLEVDGELYQMELSSIENLPGAVLLVNASM